MRPPSYIYSANSYTGKTASLYWDGPLAGLLLALVPAHEWRHNENVPIWWRHHDPPVLSLLVVVNRTPAWLAVCMHDASVSSGEGSGVQYSSKPNFLAFWVMPCCQHTDVQGISTHKPWYKISTISWNDTVQQMHYDSLVLLAVAIPMKPSKIMGGFAAQAKPTELACTFIIANNVHVTQGKSMHTTHKTIYRSLDSVYRITFVNKDHMQHLKKYSKVRRYPLEKFTFRVRCQLNTLFLYVPQNFIKSHEGPLSLTWINFNPSKDK